MSAARRHPDLLRLGHRIRDLRTANGLTQEDLAEAGDIDRAYISDLESGRHNIGVLHLLKIAKALKVPVGALFER